MEMSTLLIVSKRQVVRLVLSIKLAPCPNSTISTHTKEFSMSMASTKIPKPSFFGIVSKRTTISRIIPATAPLIRTMTTVQRSVLKSISVLLFIDTAMKFVVVTVTIGRVLMSSETLPRSVSLVSLRRTSVMRSTTVPFLLSPCLEVGWLKTTGSESF